MIFRTLFSRLNPKPALCDLVETKPIPNLNHAVNMSDTRPSFKLTIELQKQGLTIKNSVIKPTSPFTADNSIYHAANLPVHLASSVDRALSLPLQMYDLELQDIFSMAVIGRQNQRTRYIAPLNPQIVVNHVEPVFHTPELTCCKLDDKTIITFSEDDDNRVRSSN